MLVIYSPESHNEFTRPFLLNIGFNHYICDADSTRRVWKEIVPLSWWWSHPIGVHIFLAMTNKNFYPLHACRANVGGEQKRILVTFPFVCLEFLTISEIEEIKEMLENTIQYYKGNGLNSDAIIKDENFRRVSEQIENSRFYQKEPEIKQKVKRLDDLYVFRDNDNNSIKVGRSRNPKSRLKAISTSSSHDIETIAIHKRMGDFEEIVHNGLKDAGLHIRGEWFVNDPKTFEIITKTIEENE